ncbi:MAG: hypothetical protein NTU73_01320 [Ignavibacteriae bacterium]|nr:hypothetical protein [Ignavibacteriota bacterium]
MEFKKYTPEELELIFDLDFKMFLKLSQYHKENNQDYFITVITPFFIKQKNLGKVPDYEFDEKYQKEQPKNEVTNNTNNSTENTETKKTNNISSDNQFILHKIPRNENKVVTKKYFKYILYSVITVILIALFYFLYKTVLISDYDKSLSYIKDNKFNKAYNLLIKIDSTNKNYYKAKSKLNYINGINTFKNLEYEKSYSYLNSIDSSDEYFSDAKKLISQIESTSKFILIRSTKMVNENKYESALMELEKIDKKDSLYNIAQNKIYFIKGLQSFKLEYYDEAERYLRLYEIENENKPTVEMMNIKITEYNDKIKNSEYARKIINLFNTLKDECQSVDHKTIFIVRNFSRSLIASKFNEFKEIKNKASNKDEEIEKFRNKVIDYVNNELVWIDEALYYNSLTSGERYYYTSNKLEYTYNKRKPLLNEANKLKSNIKSKYDL